MVRRRSGSKKAPRKSQSRPINKADAKVARWNTVDDIPMDEEEQSRFSRDKILLDDADDDEDFDGEDDEVFALKGMSDDEDGDTGDEVQLEEDAMHVDENKTSNKQKKKENRKAKSKAAAWDSDQEEEEEEETWGQKKSAYYSSNAVQIDSDDEEANDLEEQEALRLQAKAREILSEDAFGLDESLEDDVPADDDIAIDNAKQSSVGLPQDKQSILAHLAKTCPETLALAREWDDTAITLMKTKRKLEALESQKSGARNLGMLHFYYQGLITYAATLAFYLHLRSSEKYSRRVELLQSHPILARLLSLKQSLSGLEELEFALSDSESDSEDEEDDIMADAQSLWKLAQKEGLDKDELRELLMDAITSNDVDSDDAAQVMQGLDPQKVEGESSPPPKKKRNLTKKEIAAAKKKTVRPVFDLVEPEFNTGDSAGPSNTTSDLADPYGEMTSLQYADAEDKTARKKSLRFHTSKIESASARRQGARNAAMGGDDDIPYRDRKKGKEATVKPKHLGLGGADLDNVEPDARLDDNEGSDDEGADGYYELVKRKKKDKKEKKRAEYEETRQAARPSLNEDGLNGPRSLTRSILKNKGLTPHRPKEVRNPRVKKRQKFEKAKKKVASQKAVYKGGLSETGYYEGEKTGISKIRKGISLS